MIVLSWVSIGCMRPCWLEDPTFGVHVFPYFSLELSFLGVIHILQVQRAHSTAERCSCCNKKVERKHKEQLFRLLKKCSPLVGTWSDFTLIRWEICRRHNRAHIKIWNAKKTTTYWPNFALRGDDPFVRLIDQVKWVRLSGSHSSTSGPIKGGHLFWTA